MNPSAQLVPNADDPALGRHCRLARSALRADTVLFSIVEEDRQFFPAHVGLVEPYATSGQTPRTHSICQHVIAADEPLVISDTSTHPLVADNPARHDLGIASYVGVPVRDEAGATVGVLCATTSAMRDWNDDDVSLLTDAAASLESELRLRASTDRLREQAEAERVTREYQEALEQLSLATNRLQTVQAVADELAERVAPAIGARLTSIAIIDGDELRFSHGSSVDDRVADDWPTAPIDAPVPMAAAARTGRTVHLADVASFADHPEFVVAAAALDLQSFRAIPFGSPTRGLSAVIGIGWDRPMSELDVPPAIDRVVELAGAAIDRASQFEAERNQARVLERVVLPSTLPDTATYSIDGCYIAPDAMQRIGGDVYDVVVRNDGAIGVMIADAVGHDLIATRAAARLRHAVGVLVIEGYEPAEVLNAVNRYVTSSPSKRLVTCVCLLFEADGSAVKIANAGHPQPILRADNDVRFVGPVGEMLLGRGALAYSQETVALDEGDLVLAFTDGLIDRRDRSFVESERWLLGFLDERAPADPHQIVADLQDTVSDWPIDDDVAFLAVGKRRPSDVPQLRWARPADQIRLAELRTEIDAWLTDVGFESHHDLQLVATELLTNARDASAPDEDVVFALRRPDPDSLRIRLDVTNRTPPFAYPDSMPEASSVRGRGLALVRALSESLEIESSPDSVTISVVLDLGR